MSQRLISPAEVRDAASQVSRDQNTWRDGGKAVAKMVAILTDEKPSIIDVFSTIEAHPEYPEPCPLLHEVAEKAARDMDKEWVIHMVREACRQTKQAILTELKAKFPH
jgi:hypothetical protein